ncbi:4'-phosphopantetheinyl transferase superfamily protein [Streptomyces sp. CC210A]|uniref:4'-phosphopantetheinyl transferase family protein n=1 Tax=Streptomyces sp. CC210A TaxID=2898184 RepID=UPI001F24D598|nr:4'-phosphopantetheinyl transferase superfamily protein [Streptomyces sp. CC210A]
MLDGVVAPPVCVAESFEDPPGLTLLGSEPQEVGRAVPQRQREFTTTRWCARRALSGLGFGPVPIPRGRRGAPHWPEGVVGSLTHCAGYRAAAVARADEVLSLGIDAEPHAPLPDHVLDSVSLPEERRRLTGLAADRPGVHWGRLLFSMKESVYKTWFPLAGCWLDFDEADITISPDGTFRADLLAAHPRVPADGLTGRWRVDRGLLVTALVLPR